MEVTPKTPVPDSPQVRGVWRTRGRMAGAAAPAASINSRHAPH